MSWPWSGLGLPGPADLRSIRQAYAQRLKTTHPEEDPEGFQRLHTAYQEASRLARLAARSAPESPRHTAREEEPETEARNYGKAPEDREAPEEPPEKESQPKEASWDYDKLLKGREDSRKSPQKPEQSQKDDWDYDELLEGQENPRKSPQKPEQSQKSAWDYDELLEEEPEEPDKQPEADPQSAGWDYERLFAEGEAEAQEARRRKLEELRRKNRARYTAQEQEQRRRAADEEEAWTAVMAASHALELLYSSGAPLFQWRQFLNDPVFWNVRANLDFIFALEDFLEQHPDLSPDIRKAIFAAYGFEKGPGNPVYRRLYRLLNVGRKDKRRMAKARSRWRAAWRSYPPWRKAVIVVCFSILAVFFLLGWTVNLRSAYQDFKERQEEKQWEELILVWLEEDFGEPFTLAVRDSVNIYTPVLDPTLYFWAIPDGERTESRSGYQTDYPHIRVMRAMKDFAEEWNLNLKLDSAGGGFSGNIGDAPGAYLFDLPLLGAGEAITALGERIAELEAQDWYHIPSSGTESPGQDVVEYQVFLCHRDLSFYDAVSTKGGFDADYARARYETQVGTAYCRYILENSGLASKHMGEDAYVLLDQGTVEISGGTFFHVSGLDKETYAPGVQYLMASGGGVIFCLPEGALERLSGIVDLYRGSSSSLQVNGVGLVMVWDQL